MLLPKMLIINYCNLLMRPNRDDVKIRIRSHTMPSPQITHDVEEGDQDARETLFDISLVGQVIN